MSRTGDHQDVGNLEAELTSFVGRRREVTEVSRALSTARLVTLTGVGGVGKTRLARKIGSDRRREYRDGVWFVDLASLGDEGLLAETVASSLGLQDQGTVWPVAALSAYLSEKNLLLILDNCEHVRDGCAVLVDALLRRAPDLRLLATSREALGVGGEQVIPVTPLSLPDEVGKVSLDAVGHYEAVNLFVERARAVRVSFELTEDNVGAVAAVCQRLDGIPLAIELAAARVSALSVQDLLERLEDRFHLLTGGSTAVLPRHQTLRELIGWSWDLCSTQEQILWARASVFPASFDLAAAEGVCADPILERDLVLDALTGLVQKTIVTVAEHGGVTRYRMLETLRQFGRVKLGSDADEVREKHRSYYRKSVRIARDDWFGRRQKQWLDWFEVEHSNVRLALETSFEQPATVDAGLHVVADLWVYWFATGRTSEARHWLDRGLQSRAASARARTSALARSAYLSLLQGDIARAKQTVERLQESARQGWDPSDAQGSAEYVMGLVAMGEGDLVAADRLLASAHAAHMSTSDVQWLQDVRFSMALVKALLGETEDAVGICSESIRASDAHGEVSSKSYVVWCLAFTYWRAGREDEAAAHAREALKLGLQLEQEPFVLGSCFELLAWIAAGDGRAEVAARLIGAAETIWSGTGAFLQTVRHLTSHHDECMALLRTQLSERKLAQALAAGAEMSTAQGVSEALGIEWIEPDDRGAAVNGPAVLSKRENEVAQLVAQGLTNKEIAARLVIAQRTAEAHVERILSKLGFTSRAQVAAWVAGKQPPGGR